MQEPVSHPHSDPHSGTLTGQLNWLRAAVLGANDGIVSVAGIVAGVAGATDNRSIILTAGLAGLVAGALSMAAGEYVSVSTQRDSEQAMLAKERYELEQYPDEELAELQSLYEKKGLTKETAARVAQELTDHDVFAAHVDAELNLDPDNLTNPWHAAIASAASFFAGAIIPLVAVLLPPASIRVYVAFTAVVVALAVTGTLSAKVGGANQRRATWRVVLWGVAAMVVTYGIGRLVGVDIH